MPLALPDLDIEEVARLEREFEDEAKCQWELALHSPLGFGCLVRPVVLFVIQCQGIQRLSCADIYAQWIAMNRAIPV